MLVVFKAEGKSVEALPGEVLADVSSRGVSGGRRPGAHTARASARPGWRAQAPAYSPMGWGLTLWRSPADPALSRTAHAGGWSRGGGHPAGLQPGQL